MIDTERTASDFPGVNRHAEEQEASRLTAYQRERIAREAEAERVKALYAKPAPAPAPEHDTTPIITKGQRARHTQTETMF